MASYTFSSKHDFMINAFNIHQKPYCPWLRASGFSAKQSRVVVQTRMKSLLICLTLNKDMLISAAEKGPEIISVNVDLGSRSYPVYIGSGLLNQPGLLSRHVDGKQALMVTNTTVAPLFLDKAVYALKQGYPEIRLETVVLPDGEKFKNMESVMKVYDAAIEARMDRRSTFVAVGGGVVSDICGYAASSYMRGVNFIQIPTTLMAQVDSSVGGKTGVNYRVGKNLIGAIYQPKCVLVDTNTLNYLPNRELASGIAEAIKCAMVKDGKFFEWLENNIEALLARDPIAIAYVVKRSCEIKAEIVSLDEKESGIRAILNFGHTFGHAIETSFGYGKWLHGEAVAVGMVMATVMSHRLQWIDDFTVERVKSLLQRANLPIVPPPSMTVEMFKSGMAVDKKVADGQLRLVLLKGPIGNCVFTGSFDKQALNETLLQFSKS